MRDTTEVTTETGASLVVLAATTPERFAAVVPELSQLAGLAPLVIAGAGEGKELARRTGAHLVAEEAVTAAEHLSGGIK